MADPTDYSVFKALDPFFAVIKQSLDGLVDGDHFWDFIAEDAVFEFLYNVSGATISRLPPRDVDTKRSR